MKKGTLLLILVLALLTAGSCATTKKTSYESQRAGLLMLEGENIYKNKGFYDSKTSRKARKKAYRRSKQGNKRKAKKYYKR